MIRLRELREARHWNMRQAADFLKKPYTTYVNHEKEYREPTSDDLVSYARAYEVTIDYLLGKTNDPKGYGDAFTIEAVDEDDIATMEKALKFDHLTMSMLKNFYSLNFEGQDKVINYTKDLIATGLYTRNTGSKVG